MPRSLHEPSWPGPWNRSCGEPLGSHYPGHARPRPTVTQEVSMRKDRPHVPSAGCAGGHRWRLGASRAGITKLPGLLQAPGAADKRLGKGRRDGRSGRHALLPTLPSCSQQVPDSLPPGADRELGSPGSTAVPSREPKRPEGLRRAPPGAGRSPRLAHARHRCQTSPAVQRKAPGISSKEPDSRVLGHSPVPAAPPAPGRIRSSPAQVTSCSRAGEQLKLAAQAVQQGRGGEATFPGWARGSEG